MRIEITLDGRTARAERHEMLLAVLEREGVHLHTLCHHPDLSPHGSCRLCLVEMVHPDGRSRVVTACDMPVDEGQVFVTASPRLERLRRLVAELHLARCPDEPAVREVARALGAKGGRLRRLAETCVLCGLCERVCREIVGACVLGFEGRGTSRRLNAAFGEVGDECIGCGACSHVCPTGTIRMQHAAIARFESLPGAERPCRHALTGIYPAAICSHGYDCETCEVDQRLREITGTHPALARGPSGARRLREWWERTRRPGGGDP